MTCYQFAQTQWVVNYMSVVHYLKCICFGLYYGVSTTLVRKYVYLILNAMPLLYIGEVQISMLLKILSFHAWRLCVIYALIIVDESLYLTSPSMHLIVLPSYMHVDAWFHIPKRIHCIIWSIEHRLGLEDCLGIEGCLIHIRLTPKRWLFPWS